jgi:SPOR domain
MYSKYNRTKRNLIIGCLFVMVSIIPFYKFARKFINSREQHLKSEIEMARDDSTRFADSLKRKHALKTNFNKTVTDTLMKFEDEKLAGGISGVNYYIITGSYANPENAKTAQEQYQSQGYETTIIPTSNRKGERILMLSIGTFNNADEAKKFLQEFHQKGNLNAWLYSN